MTAPQARLLAELSGELAPTERLDVEPGVLPEDPICATVSDAAGGRRSVMIGPDGSTWTE